MQRETLWTRCHYSYTLSIPCLIVKYSWFNHRIQLYMTSIDMREILPLFSSSTTTVHGLLMTVFPECTIPRYYSFIMDSHLRLSIFLFVFLLLCSNGLLSVIKNLFVQNLKSRNPCKDKDVFFQMWYIFYSKMYIYFQCGWLHAMMSNGVRRPSQGGARRPWCASGRRRFALFWMLYF